MKPKNEKTNQTERSFLMQASNVWSKACSDLGVKIVAPFTLGEGSSSIECMAFLPDFGGPNGMVIGALDLPDILPEDRFKDLATQNGLYCSRFYAIAFATRSIDERIFKEALEDWGYYGPRADRPAWFAGYDHSRD